MKRIVICADGTWQSPEKGECTNVLRLGRAIKPVASDEVDQVVFYDWGVGTDRKKIAGGISGAGIDKNIQDCYRFIVQNFDPSDHLFFFGFSRGAYTVRSLGGLIRNCGILQREHAARIPDAYELYRSRRSDFHPNSSRSVAFRRKYAVSNKSPIKFIGVWDTVGALGIPIPFLGTLGDDKYLFHDTEPSSIVEIARHAISIDENREDFKPAQWDSGKSGIDLVQAWFAGVHSDVGGGYTDRGLADAAFEWLLGEARIAGLEVEDHLTNSIAANPLGRLHNEWKGFYKLRPKFTRSLPDNATIHDSVKQRWESDSKYREREPLAGFLERHPNGWDSVETVS